MRLYDMIRDDDVSGTSGTGRVAEVCEFENGWVAVAFRLHTANVPNIICYGSLAHAEQIHGHGGKTRIVPRQESEDARLLAGYVASWWPGLEDGIAWPALADDDLVLAARRVLAKQAPS